MALSSIPSMLQSDNYQVHFGDLSKHLTCPDETVAALLKLQYEGTSHEHLFVHSTNPSMMYVYRLDQGYFLPTGHVIMKVPIAPVATPLVTHGCTHECVQPRKRQRATTQQVKYLEAAYNKDTLPSRSLIEKYSL